MMEPYMRHASAHSALSLSKLFRLVLLLILFAQLLFSAILKSPTIDEPNHLTRGFAYLKSGDLRLSRDEGHPPLFNLLSALPLLVLRDLSLPTHSHSWQIGFRNAFAIEWVFAGAVPVQRMFFLARLSSILTTVLLAALVTRWANEVYGSWGSLVALTICAFDPNLIAHGHLVTTDIGITFFLCLAAYLFWRFLHRPSPWALVLSGVAVGLALGVKFSAIVILPMLGLLGLVETFYPHNALHWPGHPQLAGQHWLSALLAWVGTMLVIVVLSGLTVWGVYAFEIGQPAGWSFTMPAPTYVEGLSKTLNHVSEIGHPAFLMGQRSTHGWWYYFPVAFALKTPLPALIALLCAAVSIAYQRLSRAEWPLLLIPLVYFAFSVRSQLNVGYRHLLPMLPFLWIYVGRLGVVCRGNRNRWTMTGLLALGFWLAGGTLTVAPDYLAYFNALAGGTDGGWRYLVDSNLDWGQELLAIREYAESRNESPLYLSWFGSTYPHLYGYDFEYRLLPSHFSYPYPNDAARSAYNPLHPTPGLYVIGATNLQGVGLAAGDVFARFRDQVPTARIGHSTFVYEVTEASSDVYPTCISGLRFKDLSAETTALTLGRGTGAVKWFDHATSFILPGRGDPAYVLPAPPLAFAPPLHDAFLAHAAIVHIQGEGDAYPPATVYHLDRASADALSSDLLASVVTGPLHWSHAVRFDESAELHPLSTPVAFEYGLEFAGYDLISGQDIAPGQTIELLTFWRATSEMPAAAADLRVFVHLLDDQSRTWSAEDRLDLNPPTWEANDLLIQYHRLPVAADAPAGVYQLEVGLYTAIRMQRLPVYVDATAITDRLLLQPIEVHAP